MTAPPFTHTSDHVLTQARDVVKVALTGLAWDVYRWFPDDVGALPCAVVERPRLRMAARTVTTTLVVDVIGRRIADDDTQAQLDQVADRAFTLLASSRDFDVTGVTPGLVRVAGSEFPAYGIEIAFPSIFCYPSKGN